MRHKDTRKGLDTKFGVSNWVIAGELNRSQFGKGIEVEMS